MLAAVANCHGAEPPDDVEREFASPEMFESLRPEDAFEEPTESGPPLSNIQKSRSARPGGTGRRGSGRPGGGPPGYILSWYPSQGVSGQNGDLSLLRHSLSAAAPLWTGDGDALMVSLGVGNLHFDGNATLPESGRPFPKDLWNINFGLSFMHQFENGWSGMLMTGFGSASDDPFHSADELNGMIGGTILVPAHNDRDAWNLGAIYSPTGSLNFPIPVVAYRWTPSGVFQMNLGIPFSVTWRPAPEWNVNLSYMPLTNVNARISYQASESILFYGAYENHTDAYRLVERERSRDRFFVIEQRLVTGCEWRFTDHLTACVNGGFAFGREFGEGENQSDDLRDELSISPGPFAGLNVQLSF